MIVVCENCKASFLVPASLLSGNQRKVKCGRCGHVWVAEKKQHKAPQEQPVPATPQNQKPPDLGAFSPPPAASGTLAPPRNAVKPAILAAWASVLVVAILVLFVSFSIFLHDAIVQRWPTAQFAYIVVGLVEPPGEDAFLLRDIRSVRRYQDGAMRLVVTGQILNKSSKIQLVPAINAEALGPDSVVIERWRIEPPQATLKPGAAVSFSSAILCPNESVADVTLRFAGILHDE